MKFCKDCEFAETKGFIHNGKGGTILLCSNMECREPVLGDMIPCEFARKEQVFCGIQGKHFKLKQEVKSASLLELK